MSKTHTQIRIGTPGKERASQVFLETFGLTAITCLVGFAVAIPYIFLSPQTSEPNAPVDEPTQLLRAADALASLSLEQARQQVSQWDLAQQKAAILHGPRHLSEVMCEQVMLADTPSPALRDLMAASLARRDEHAPRICLMAHFLSGTDAPQDELATQVRAYWEDMQSFSTISEQNAFLVNGLRDSKRLYVKPNVGWMRWLRRCALRTQDASWPSCVTAMQELAPGQVHDLLEMAEWHLMDRADLLQPIPKDQLIEVAGLLAMLAAGGSPKEWRTTSHPRMIAYEYDLQLASIFALCRFTMSNERDVAVAAAQHLMRVMGKNPLMDNRELFRARDTCRIAFGGNRHDLEVASVPLLADNDVPALKVLDSSITDVPRYEFADLIKRGDCTYTKGYPLWYCGAQLWKGESSQLVEELKSAYVNTRYVLWVAPDEMPDLNTSLFRNPGDQKIKP